MVVPLILNEKQKLLSCPEYWKRLELYIEDEKWKPVKGYEGYYEVSSFGRIKSLKRYIERSNNAPILTVKERILKLGVAKKRGGYLIATLAFGNKHKSFWVHRLVGESYIKNQYNKRTINHKRGKVKDNRETELEWNTDLENNQHAFDVLGRTYRLVPSKAGESHHANKKVYCITNGITYFSTRNAADKLNVQQAKVSMVCNGLRNQTGGYVFKFI